VLEGVGIGRALRTIAAWRGTVLNHQHPILEAELPIDGKMGRTLLSK